MFGESTDDESAPMTSRPIRFYFRGQIVEVSGPPATRSVLDWLREDQACSGTKEGCNEGDCGACMVMVAELAADGSASAADLLPVPPSAASAARSATTATAAAGPASGGNAITRLSAAAPAIRLRPMNACLMFLPTLDGKALYTVEDLQPLAARAHPSHAGLYNAGEPGTTGPSHTKALHPAQQALVDCHGSQCGFCTPGFAVSLAAFYETHAEPPAPNVIRQQLADALSGNLCRCTGYRPILDAGERMFDLPGAHLDRQALTTALTTLAQDAPLHYAAPPLGQPAGAAHDHFHAPRSAAELARLRSELPGARLLGGATDVGLWVTKGLKSLGDIVYVGAAADLGRIEVVDAPSAAASARTQPAASTAAAAPNASPGISSPTAPSVLRIGAAVSLEDAWRALAGHWPELTEVWRRFASPPVRHAGTLVGNLANGSPIGDSPPVAIALGASLVLRQGDQERRLLLEDFSVDYMKNQLQPGEFVSHVELPLPLAPAAGTRQVLRAWKISKRYDSDISALCAGLALTLAADGTVADVRLAFGGMAATVRRAPGAEAALRGQPWSETSVRTAMAALASDYTPLTDLRATSRYRVKVAANLLWRLWLEAGTPALPASSTQVWVAGGLLAPASA
ncbi:MAG: hypothetical protein RL375_3898 [Pseudomonadota bacterium]